MIISFATYAFLCTFQKYSSAIKKYWTMILKELITTHIESFPFVEISSVFVNSMCVWHSCTLFTDPFNVLKRGIFKRSIHDPKR